MNCKYLLLLLSIICCHSHAQVLSFKDSVTAYNTQRIKINQHGMYVLGAWGIANIAMGGASYFTAKQEDEWKYFHEMNAFWGVVNTGLAAAGLVNARKEMAAKLSYRKSYDRYRADKRLYLINAGLDVVYIGTGVALNEYGRTAGRDKVIFQGFGKSVGVQGIFLLLFDNVMFAAHMRNNSKWATLMYELRFTGREVGFVHQF